MVIAIDTILDFFFKIEIVLFTQPAITHITIGISSHQDNSHLYHQIGT